MRSTFPFRAVVWTFLLLILVVGGMSPDSRAGKVTPRSWEHTEALPLDQVSLHEMPAVDPEALRAEDLRQQENRKVLADWIQEGGAVPARLLAEVTAEARASLTGFVLQAGQPVPDSLLELAEKPKRVGHPMDVRLSPSDSGTWETLADGGRIWRLRVHSEGALWMVLGFRTFRPAPGARLHVFDPARRTVLGPFTERHIQGHRQLWLPPVDGDTLVVELYWPAGLRSSPDLLLSKVSHGYIDLAPLPVEDPISPDSGFCNIDVNCPLGAEWQDQKRGVVHLLLYGSSWCSGSLINSTAGNCKPYVLTARHCMDTPSEAAATTFRFNYERPGCDSGSAPTSQTLTGSTLRASYGNSDMTLLEMDEAPLPEFGAYFNGWSRLTSASPDSTGIHHPSGDAKKISYNEDPLVNGINYGADHWRINQWEQGTTEGGSSGSPLFDQSQHIVGQLHGGTASCYSITWDEYGKLDVSWTGGGSDSSRLSTWLDPVGSGVETLDGLDHTTCLNPLPQLELQDLFSSDDLGNANGFPDPGEGIELDVDLGNSGSSAATGISGTISTTTPGATVMTASTTWPDVPEGSSRICDTPFELQLEPDYPCGQPVTVTLQLDFAESVETAFIDFELPVGAPEFIGEYADDMENGLNGWSANIWGQTTQDSSSPSHSWFVKDQPSQIDALLMTPELSDLPADTRLLFQHRYKTQSNVDGGVLEYSLDNGSTWIDAGSLLVANGYTGLIGSGVDSPLAGRSAWTDDSGGWQQVEADLSTLAGMNVRLRWRFATDTAVGDTGWFVDDVVVEHTIYSCSDVLPGEASDPSGQGGLFRIDRGPAGEYELSWSEPTVGTIPTGYKLYRIDLAQALAPDCETDLGAGTSMSMVSLSENRGFLVVPVNALGEGSYGTDSEGNQRVHADGESVCP